uniref:Peroxiredoxin-1 n=1 Tax=Vombatus ursinus TaxID=29139 RepID=A0A4X2LJS0_VOMUR
PPPALSLSRDQKLIKVVPGKPPSPSLVPLHVFVFSLNLSAEPSCYCQHGCGKCQDWVPSPRFQSYSCYARSAVQRPQPFRLQRVNTVKKNGGLGAVNIPLMSDPKRTIAQDYGVLKADEGISFRGLFIIDDKGVLRQITINDLPVGRSVDETLRLVQAFQFTDKHGEVCPAGWKPGSDTIKPDVQGSKEYFSKQN